MPSRPTLLGILLLLVFPALAGCLEPSPPPSGDDGAPGADGQGATTTPPTLTPGGTPAGSPFATPSLPPTASPSPAGPRCARLVAETQPATGFRPGEEATVIVALENCGGAPLATLVPTCPDPARVTTTLAIGNRTWHLAHGPGRPEPLAVACEAHLVDVPPGERTSVTKAFWSGTLAEGDCPDGRPYCAWAPAGTYRGEAVFRDANGDAWNASFSVTLLPPRLPPYDEDGDLRLVLNDSYAQGETAEVRLRNVGDRTFVYNKAYAACGLAYYNATGYPFLVPEGTHCDLIHEVHLAPGEEAVLFRWGLRECVNDQWGCAESRPLPPGTYHVSGWFREQHARHDDASARSRVGATFAIT